ncbi:TOPRIM nucleotidyl transferase/hydrolase domain-containing protein [Inquilinus sp. Marseille-Q2685]|uniref:TOPRIM nucleotidyl transferase/hydrolase domain-containing protein n=1 Tax=Inquilinus sp. Marseille-Q2685 TaxID=2866581 RepID=UPI001CE3BA8C|nr:TOPRIM nucleotidyl transferase/hydrolase domain-containing protein [Inquilinus sp. Marseille-Q2685]
MLVEGISDQIAVETLASLEARDLAAEGVVVVPVGGVRSVSGFLARFGPAGAGLRVGGLCDAAEERHVCRALARAGFVPPESRSQLEAEGFFVCDRDLEDELIRAVGRDAIEAILAEEGDLASFRTLQRQAAWRDAGFDDQVRRFLGAGARRKLRYAGLFVLALPPDHQPRPLRGVLSRV